MGVFFLTAVLLVVLPAVAFTLVAHHRGITGLLEQREDDQREFHRALDRERVHRDRQQQAAAVQIAVLEADLRAAQLVEVELGRQLELLQPVRAELLTLVGNLNEQISLLEASVDQHFGTVTAQTAPLTAAAEQMRGEIRQFIDTVTGLVEQSRADYQMLLTENEGIIRFLNEVPQNFGLHLETKTYKLLLPDRLKMELGREI